MAMYYQGSSDIQADGLHTLYLMNPNYLSSYSDPHPNTPFFNPAIAPPPPQQFMDIPSHDPSHPSPSHEIAIPRFGHHHLWGSVDHHRHQFACGNSNQPNTPQQQTPKGLSLSLAPGFSKSIHDNPTGDDQNFRGKIIWPGIDEVDGNNDNNNNSVGSVIMGSKYLKAVRELLDEVVSVGRETRSDGPEGAKDKAKMVKESIRAKVGESSEEYGTKSGGDELTTTQRLEIQMKKAKLSNMLDEVEQRYKQYHHQMQTIVTSFDQVAGAGSAKSYTHLALKTILKQFRCLKNTISSQIKALNTTLGEDENTKGSKLKFVDHHFRQQRALQQLGTMQNNNVAWRQQRGLPEKAVSVLRAWLFEHFLHPYPKESDKHMLAKQTGLTKSQVSNWFINARVRLWKPMVEEMYLEEVKNQEINPDDNTIKFESRIGIESRKTLINSKSNLSQQASNIPKTPIIKNLNTLQSMQNNKPTLNLVTSSSHISASTIITKSTTRNIENPLEKNPKKRRNKNQDNSPSSILSVDIETKPGEYHTSNGFNNNITFINMNSEHTRENYLSSSGFSNTYGILSTGELPNRFNNNVDDDRQQIPFGFQRNNSNFSLTLALPPSETYPQGAHQRNFLSQGSFEFGTRIEPVGSNNRPNIGNYDQILDFQNRKSFSTQILPGHHFVA